MLKIEIDEGSGFCFGVTTAIKKAEEELANGSNLYCLGDIVHNGMECERLKRMGLTTINHDEMKQLHNAKGLLRAHGEPPTTYARAIRNEIEIIDATCPVVLQLQRRICRQYECCPDAQIVIFGKPGHAEVLGLVGQTQNHAIVIAHFEDVKKLDFTHDIYLYSQTTKSLDEFHRIIDYIQTHISPTATFRSFDTMVPAERLRPLRGRLRLLRRMEGALLEDAVSQIACAAVSRRHISVHGPATG